MSVDEQAVTVTPAEAQNPGMHAAVTRKDGHPEGAGWILRLISVTMKLA